MLQHTGSTVRVSKVSFRNLKLPALDSRALHLEVRTINITGLAALNDFFSLTVTCQASSQAQRSLSELGAGYRISAITTVTGPLYQLPSQPDSESVSVCASNCITFTAAK